MFPNLLTYHVHRGDPLPANDALAYQYILAGNGVFVRADTRFFAALLLIASCAVRGLPPLHPCFHLRVPRMPASLLHTLLTDARRARQPDGGLNEVLYHFHHRGHTVQVCKPRQQASPTRVLAAGNNEPILLCDLHSHGHMPAFFSTADNADEQGIRLYAVIGRLDNAPEIQLRVGVCGYWQPLPVTAAFTDRGPFQDLYLKENPP